MTAPRTSALLATVGLIGVLLPATAAARSSAPGAQATTKSYVFKLSIGMPEKMWTMAQVKAKHPTTGEVMVMGAMGGAMSMGGSQRHLEVHILSRASHKPVTGARPTMTAIDTSTKNAMAIRIPVAAMEGVTSGAADLHYGNNVDLVGGHRYKVTVVLNGQRAVLAARSPK